MPTIDGPQLVQNIESLYTNEGERKIGTSPGESVARCTIKDVARLAKVSTATVSRVANGAEGVSRRTRASVLSAISRLRYYPDANATALARVRRDITRKRGIESSSSAKLEPDLLSHPTVNMPPKCQRAERLRLLQDENARLRRAVLNLNLELERWRSIAQSANRR